MKISISILIYILFAIQLSGQQKVTLPDGKKIVVYPDKTWEYESEEVIKTSNFDDIIIDLKSYTLVYKHPSDESLALKSFTKKGVILIGYMYGMFQIKSSTGQIGYTPVRYIDNASKYKPMLERRSVSTANEEGRKINIRGAAVQEINSANGIEFLIDWGYFDNLKDIKYIEFSVTPYNKVGDVQRCTIGGHSTFKGKVTGPISAANEFYQHFWESAWYNNTISCLKITKVTVKYMDNSSYIYVKELPDILGE